MLLLEIFMLHLLLMLDLFVIYSYALGYKNQWEREQKYEICVNNEFYDFCTCLVELFVMFIVNRGIFSMEISAVFPKAIP